MALRCPAKVNLFLAVGPKDSRNYHPLRTIFQAVDLCDVITLAPSTTNRHQVLFDDPSIPEMNTISRTLRLLSEVVSIPRLTVSVQKHIPPESGLGGGSSNAAAIIRAAQRLAKTTIPEGELRGIAEAIGMDVPFFLIGGRARGEGYGEKVTALPDAASQWIVLARPVIGCSTPLMYQKLDEDPYPWRDFPTEDEVYNDFEKTAPFESIELIESLKSNGAENATLCGSGSAVFGLFGDRKLAEGAKKALHDLGAPKIWLTRTLSRSESLRAD